MKQLTSFGKCLLMSLWLCGLSIAVNAETARTPPQLLLATRYVEGTDPSAYLISEKLDGVRAYWDGKQLQLRSGNIINAPSWFTNAMPIQHLDGELWIGRGSFDMLSGLIRKISPDDSAWRQVRYMIFELPDESAELGTFNERYSRIKTIVAKANILWLQAVEQFRVNDQNELNNKLAEIVQAGGEGLMLHRADALYETGRSKSLQKLTPQLDAEAKIVGYTNGKGKYNAMVGALRVEMPNGKQFKIGSGLSDANRKTPPAIGAIVTYRYRSLTKNGIPRFPIFLRIRERF